jgi:type III restriction enzyme
MKNLEITKEHFQNLYDKVPVTSNVYDSRKVSALRGFASANSIQILVINIDSFAKDEKSVFGAGSSEYKQISGIKFTKPR